MLRMARSPKTWLLMATWLILGLAAGTGAWIWARGQATTEMPLGVPLPAVVPQYTVIPKDSEEGVSLLERRMPEGMLGQLAAQPDGLAPLKYPINSEMADFKIRHPFGAQTVSFPYEDVAKDGVLIQAEILFDQPVQALKYSVERRMDGESVVEFTKRLEEAMVPGGEGLYPDTTPFEVDGYRFEHFEYERQSEEGGPVLTHFMYVGSLGPRQALVMNFMTTPGLHERARPGVLKILGSFTPGWQMLEYDRQERAGEDLQVLDPPPAEVDGGTSTGAL